MMSVIRAVLRLARLVWDLIVRIVVALLVPPRCAACDELLERRAVFCGPCAATVERTERAESFARYRYGGALKTAIVRFKYGDRPDLADALGQVLVRGLGELARGGEHVVVPVPLHAARLAERGFNQSALLGQIVARHTGWPLRARALSRARATQAQASLGAEARAANVEGAFEARDASEVRGRDVVLVDDVTTTGSTLRGCRAALERAGARSVVCLALASQELTRSKKGSAEVVEP